MKNRQNIIQKKGGLSLIEKFVRWVKEGDLHIVVGGPIILGFILLVVLLTGYYEIFKENYSNTFGAFIVGFCMFIIGLSGVSQIIRREMPGFALDKPIRGVWPIISGILTILFFWLGSLVGILVFLTGQ